MPITLIQGDITTAEVDAIVNAANAVMLGGGGVDGAIHRAAGPQLRAACEAVPAVHGIRCPTGEARITAAGQLACKFVIHTVGPRFDIDPDPPGLLASAYRNSLQLALAHDCHSVALPAVSCGVYGFPPAQAAPIAVNTCREAAFEPLDIRFYLFGDDVFAAWQAAVNDIPAPD